MLPVMTGLTLWLKIKIKIFFWLSAFMQGMLRSCVESLSSSSVHIQCLDISFEFIHRIVFLFIYSYIVYSLFRSIYRKSSFSSAKLLKSFYTFERLYWKRHSYWIHWQATEATSRQIFFLRKYHQLYFGSIWWQNLALCLHVLVYTYSYKSIYQIDTS